ncbi:unnamed protein product [Pieris brassicae]|uniref:Ig-like domain-containing protein n=1 Tax=Pieris brassicae TaxID=7116 RepID=A0A9P0TKF9_PIEBR|nr:unnamed protein product [Pieris brassicae]
MAPALLVALLAALLSPSTQKSGVDWETATSSFGVGQLRIGDPSEAEAAAAEAALAAENAPAWRELWQASLEALRREPELNSTAETVRAQLGSVAFLHCPVRHLAERQVSWVRRRDWHIISSGAFVYTNDERFQVLHREGSEDWVLQIKYVQKRDNGTYECQVSSSSGALSRQVHLQVVVPEALILGAEELHVDSGSAVRLVCLIENSPEPPQYVFWYHNARMINYDAARGVSVQTAAATRGARTQSSLSVHRARPDHSGNYSCRAPNAEPAHIYLYVSEGSDKMAATLSRSAAATNYSETTLAVLLCVAVAAVLGCPKRLHRC